MAGFGEFMLLAYGNKSASFDNIEDSFILKMQDGLSVTMYQQGLNPEYESLQLPGHNQMHS